MDELTRLMGVIGYNSPIGVSVASSPADPDANAIWVSQAGLGMPHRGYYLSTGFQDGCPAPRLSRAHHQHAPAHGQARSQGGAKASTILNARLLKPTPMKTARSAPNRPCGTMTLPELKAYAPGFNWDLFLDAGGLKGRRSALSSPTRPPLPILQSWCLRSHSKIGSSWMEFHFVNEFASYLPKAYADSEFEFFSKRLAGLEETACWRQGAGLLQYLAWGEACYRRSCSPDRRRHRRHRRQHRALSSAAVSSNERAMPQQAPLPLRQAVIKLPGVAADFAAFTELQAGQAMACCCSLATIEHEEMRDQYQPNTAILLTATTW